MGTLLAFGYDPNLVYEREIFTASDGVFAVDWYPRKPPPSAGAAATAAAAAAAGARAASVRQTRASAAAASSSSSSSSSTSAQSSSSPSLKICVFYPGLGLGSGNVRPSCRLFHLALPRLASPRVISSNNRLPTSYPPTQKFAQQFVDTMSREGYHCAVVTSRGVDVPLQSSRFWFPGFFDDSKVRHWPAWNAL